MSDTNAAPEFKKYPDHIVTLEPVVGSVRVEAFGQTVADTIAAIRVRESRYAPVIYVPRGDVRFDLLQPSELTTHCPFKGDASYWSIRVGDHHIGDAAWGYASPYDEVAELAGYVAFYTNRIDGIYMNDEMQPRSELT